MEASALRRHLEPDSLETPRLGATASPIPRAGAAAAPSTEFGGGRKRAGPKGRALDGGGNPNRTEGSNPSLSADIPDSSSLLQTAALSALPTGCPKSSSPIASRKALGARCMYRRVMLSVE